MGYNYYKYFTHPHVSVNDEGEIFIEWASAEARVLICIDNSKLENELDSPVYGIYTTHTEQELKPIYGQNDVLYFLNKLGLKPE